MTLDDVQVRPAVAADHPAVLALAGELTAGVPPWRPADGVAAAARSWVADACSATDDGHVLLVACGPDGGVLGFAGRARAGTSAVSGRSTSASWSWPRPPAGAGWPPGW